MKRATHKALATTIEENRQEILIAGHVSTMERRTALAAALRAATTAAATSAVIREAVAATIEGYLPAADLKPILYAAQVLRSLAKAEQEESWLINNK